MSLRAPWAVAWLAVLAALQFATGSGSLSDLVSPTTAAWVQLVVGMLEAATVVVFGRQALARRDPPA